MGHVFDGCIMRGTNLGADNWYFTLQYESIRDANIKKKIEYVFVKFSAFHSAVIVAAQLVLPCQPHPYTDYNR